MATSYKKRGAGTKAVTVRLKTETLRTVMRALDVATQSELLQRLLDEANERIRTEAVLRATAGKVGAGDIDARLL